MKIRPNMKTSLGLKPGDWKDAGDLLMLRASDDDNNNSETMTRIQLIFFPTHHDRFCLFLSSPLAVGHLHLSSESALLAGSCLD